MTERARNIQPCHITWQGNSVTVTYEPDWLRLERHGLLIAHSTEPTGSRRSIRLSGSSHRGIRE
jgi:hypothetical protein